MAVSEQRHLNFNLWHNLHDDEVLHVDVERMSVYCSTYFAI